MDNKKPRILFVAMLDSVHTARWVSQFEDTDWDIHLFPSTDSAIHPLFRDVTIHGITTRPTKLEASVKTPGALPNIFSKALSGVKLVKDIMQKGDLSKKSEFIERGKQLTRVIKKINPDIVHTLEMQHSGYLSLHAKENLGDTFPKWVYTPWGNDIFFFGRISGHAEKIREVLSQCDYYCPKSNRDILLGRQFGFKGKMLPLFPGNGGIDMAYFRKFWSPGPSSSRRNILVKGYQGIMGRGLVALHALELCVESLQGYSILVYLAGEDVKLKCELMKHDTGLDISCIPYMSHEEMLKLYGKSRVSLGVSISDGVSNSLLEAMAMGSFPIESITSCADEWIRSGETGFIVPPENPCVIADCMKKALSDDKLVDKATSINEEKIKKCLDTTFLKPRAIKMYQEILLERKQ